MGTTVHHPAGFHSMPNDAAAAMTAFRREGMNGAFETVEVMRDAILNNFERFVIFVAAHLAIVNARVQVRLSIRG
jgi:hypothetical protein